MIITLRIFVFGVFLRLLSIRTVTSVLLLLVLPLLSSSMFLIYVHRHIIMVYSSYRLNIKFLIVLLVVAHRVPMRPLLVFVLRFNITNISSTLAFRRMFVLLLFFVLCAGVILLIIIILLRSIISLLVYSS